MPKPDLVIDNRCYLSEVAQAADSLEQFPQKRIPMPRLGTGILSLEMRSLEIATFKRCSDLAQGRNDFGQGKVIFCQAASIVGREADDNTVVGDF